MPAVLAQQDDENEQLEFEGIPGSTGILPASYLFYAVALYKPPAGKMPALPGARFS